jgi:hypothetical protein
MPRLSQSLLNIWDTKWLLSWTTTIPNIEHKKYVKNLRLITKKKKQNYNISCSLVCCSWTMFIHEHLLSSKMYEIHLSLVNPTFMDESHPWKSNFHPWWIFKTFLIPFNFSFMDEVHYEHLASPIMKKNHPSSSTFNPVIKFIKHKTFFIYNTWNSSTTFSFFINNKSFQNCPRTPWMVGLLVDSITISLN